MSADAMATALSTTSAEGGGGDQGDDAGAVVGGEGEAGHDGADPAPVVEDRQRVEVGVVARVDRALGPRRQRAGGRVGLGVDGRARAGRRSPSKIHTCVATPEPAICGGRPMPRPRRRAGWPARSAARARTISSASLARLRAEGDVEGDDDQHQRHADAGDDGEEQPRAEGARPARAHRITYPTPWTVSRAGASGERAQLAPQARDVGVERVVVDDRPVRPPGAHQLPAPHGLARPREQGREDAELGGREALLDVAGADRVGRRGRARRRRRARARPATARAPHQHPQPRHQLVEGEGLGRGSRRRPPRSRRGGRPGRRGRSGRARASRCRGRAAPGRRRGRRSRAGRCRRPGRRAPRSATRSSRRAPVSTTSQRNPSSGEAAREHRAQRRVVLHHHHERSIRASRGDYRANRGAPALPRRGSRAAAR